MENMFKRWIKAACDADVWIRDVRCVALRRAVTKRERFVKQNKGIWFECNTIPIDT